MEWGQWREELSVEGGWVQEKGVDLVPRPHPLMRKGVW